MTQHGGSKAMRRARRRASAGIGAADKRKVQVLEELIHPPHMFQKQGPRTSGTHGTHSTHGMFGTSGITEEKASVADSKNNSDSEEEEEYHDDPRDLDAVEHLKEHHPRGQETGAGHLRSSVVKSFCQMFNYEKWVDVHRRVILLGINIAKDARTNSESKRAAMDSSKVFHPDANRLRAEAQLSVQLRRKVQYDQLEVAVLEEMLNQEQQKHVSSREKDSLELNGAFQKAKGKNVSRSTRVTTTDMRRNTNIYSGTASIGKTCVHSGSGARRTQKTESGFPPMRQFDEKEFHKNVGDEVDSVTGSLIGIGRVMSFDEYRERRKHREQEKGKEEVTSKTKTKADSHFMPMDDYVRMRFLGAGANRFNKLRKPKLGTLIGEKKGDNLRRRNRRNGGDEDEGNRLGAEDEQEASDSDYSGPSSDYSTSDEEQDQDQSTALPDAAAAAAEAAAAAAAATGLQEGDWSNVRPRSSSSKRAGRRRRQQRRTILSKNEQSRLFNILQDTFRLLEMNPADQLEFCIKYSDPENATVTEDALNEWRRMADVVALFERCVQVAELARDKKVDAKNAFTEAETTALEQLDCYVSMAQMFGSTCAKWVEAILVDLSKHCEQVVRELEARWGDTLKFRGHSYYKLRFSPGINKSKPLKPLKPCGNAFMMRIGALLLRQ